MSRLTDMAARIKAAEKSLDDLAAAPDSGTTFEGRTYTMADREGFRRFVDRLRADYQATLVKRYQGTRWGTLSIRQSTEAD